MLKNIYTVKLDIKQQAPMQTGINFISADNQTSALHIIIKDGDNVIDYAQVASAIIVFAKQDGTVVQGDLVLNSNANYYTYEIGTNEIAVKGSLACSVALYGLENERLTASKFTCTVDANPLTASAVESSTEFDALAKAVILLNEVEQGIESGAYKGDKGDTGEQGIKGETGITPNIQIGTVETLPAGSVSTAEITGTAENPILNLSIVRGDKGEQGIQGLKGDKGDTGATGMVGATGLQGLQGIQGIQGDKGEKGDPGEQGMQGERGEKGDTGPQGIQGTRGEQGPQGEPGPQSNDFGDIKITARIIPPDKWLICDGSAVSRQTYADLFNAIGTAFGAGDGNSTFNIPDLRGRFSIGLDSTQTEFNSIGKTGGNTVVTIKKEQMPSHVHSISGSGTLNINDLIVKQPASVAGATVANPKNAYPALGNVDGLGDTVNSYSTQLSNNTYLAPAVIEGTGSLTLDGNTGSAGGGESIDILPPYAVLNYIIYAGV